jgi:hypothetical protein
MSQEHPTERPILVTLICIFLLLSAVYLWIGAAILIFAPYRISLFFASRLMHGLELAGPYMILLVGCGYGLIGWGLFRLHNWARWLATLLLALLIGSLVPVISTVQFGAKFFECGGEIAIFAAAGLYLAQAPTVLEAFTKTFSQRTTPRIYTDLRG